MLQGVYQLALIGFLSSIFVILILVGLAIHARRKRERRDLLRLEEVEEQGDNLPPTLHPVIDPDLCQGCQACLSVCPEGDILGLIKGKAVLINANNCIGHGKCAEACPTQAIRLVFGSSQRGVDLPVLNEFFETNRPGLHIIGELGGMGLIKNAVEQGTQIGRYLRRIIESDRSTDTDVAIIGAGPAGLAAALSCQEEGLTFRIFDQNSLGGTIANFPRQKIVLAESITLPNQAQIPKDRLSKEALIQTWQEIIESADITIHEHVQALDVEGDNGNFAVVTSKGIFSSRKVILATGRRGQPKPLNVPGEQLAKVTYNLIDPQQYADKRVLVVGGGDSALEAAVALCEQNGATVTLSYRGRAFARANASNRRQVQALARDKRIHIVLESEVLAIHEPYVELAVKGKIRRLGNDYVVVCIGGTLPMEFLNKLGIETEQHFGAKGNAFQSRQDQQKVSWAALIVFALGAVTVGVMSGLGWEYYGLSRQARGDSPWHELLRPSGVVGHGIGIVATLVMLSNFGYSARKRLNIFRFFSVRTWFTLHTSLGIICPMVILFHSAFQFNNMIAVLTSISMGTVMITGLLGRFLYALVPMRDGRMQALQDLRHEEMRLGKELRGTLSGSLLRKTQMHHGRVKQQIATYSSLRSIFFAWRLIHIVLACALVVVVVLHISISLYLGFGWILL